MQSRNMHHGFRGRKGNGETGGSFHEGLLGDNGQLVLPGPTQANARSKQLKRAEEELAELNRQGLRVHDKVHVLQLASEAESILKGYPGAASVELMAWTEEVDDFGGYSLTLGEVYDADGAALGPSGANLSISSAHYGTGPLAWDEAYVGEGGPWNDGLLDLGKLVELGNRQVAPEPVRWAGPARDHDPAARLAAARAIQENAQAALKAAEEQMVASSLHGAVARLRQAHPGATRLVLENNEDGAWDVHVDTGDGKLLSAYEEGVDADCGDGLWLSDELWEWTSGIDERNVWIVAPWCTGYVDPENAEGLEVDRHGRVARAEINLELFR